MPCPFTTCARKILTMPGSALTLLAASLGALGFAFVMQYGFDLPPCTLCLWQRWPYAVASALSLLCLLARPYGRKSVFFIISCALCYIAGIGLALFHSGVERHFWAGTSSCSVEPLGAGSTEDLRQMLLHTMTARCDEIAWTFLDLSMANWNILISFILAIFTTVAAARIVETAQRRK
jgi:disulfide bond formation protein DsbB